MKEFPSPPNEEDIQQAVHTLQAANLLSVDEHPTPLAAAVMSISASLPSALALIYSAIFRSGKKWSSIQHFKEFSGNVYCLFSFKQKLSVWSTDASV